MRRLAFAFILCVLLDCKRAPKEVKEPHTIADVYAQAKPLEGDSLKVKLLKLLTKTIDIPTSPPFVCKVPADWTCVWRTEEARFECKGVAGSVTWSVEKPKGNERQRIDSTAARVLQAIEDEKHGIIHPNQWVTKLASTIGSAFENNGRTGPPGLEYFGIPDVPNPEWTLRVSSTSWGTDTALTEAIVASTRSK